MNCPDTAKIEAWIADYLAGTLAAAATGELQAHLAACPSCRVEVDGLAQVWAGLGLVPDEEPSAALRGRFYAHLEAALAEMAEEEGRSLASLSLGDRLARWWRDRPLRFSAAAAVAALLLVTLGVALGARWRGGEVAVTRPATGPATAGGLAELRGEVQAMGRLLALSLLAQDSASERLKGVRWGERSAGGDEQVTAALVATLNDDPNVNVRLAAVEALARFADRPALVADLAAALPRQTSPLVQLALVEAVVAADGQRAAAALETLLREPGLDPTVRERAAHRLAQLG